MNNLEENLESRIKLRFRDGRFRVLIFSDLHVVRNYDTRVVRDMDAIIEGTSPDIVVLNGDIGWGDAVENTDTLRDFLTGITEPFERRGLPWTFVFGNHDSERNLMNEEQFGVYASFEHCLAKKGPDEVDGTGNYVLPVYDSEGKNIILNLWGLDSHDNFSDYRKEFGLREDPWFFNLPDPLYANSGYDSIRFSQIMWYWNTSEQLNAYAGRKIPGLMFFHIPIPQFVVLYRNTAQTYYEGTRRESVGCSPIDSGLFNALVERGEVNTVVCGHDHINDFEGEYCNIRLAMDGGMGYDGYCDEDLRGGRIVDYREEDPTKPFTYMVRSAEYVENYPGEESRIYGNDNK